MIKVVILGGGNLAFHLTNTMLKTSSINLVQVYNRSLSKIKYLKGKTLITNNIDELKDADIYIVSVSDNAISELTSKLVLKNKLVVHTSGAANITELQSNSRKGVFYPLQSFSKEKEINFKEVPFCLETENKLDFKLLKKISTLLGSNSYNINSEQRKKLHVAAVFVNNFVNHLYYLGNEICDENNIPFEILKPLIKETSNKIIDLQPFDAQTGPAIRKDSKTINKHLELLNENQQKIYSILTKSIIETYGKKL
ncbi:Rossmann-like and DUF2520 domain-containing protein [uncultured Lutibacter sp.]|uniref:Rossmann-like and DUF2520 domain-containing protein n=1 Tax=uncultured Lutibacter sp. TaxID=437739 RepID=UPI0026130CFE|nr:Rossmann-like and DUF2520 domain-containing protein [uncultured Lutibacter sp.]